MLRVRIMLLAVSTVVVILGLLGYFRWEREIASRQDRDELRLTAIEQDWQLISTGAIERVETTVLGRLKGHAVIRAIDERNRSYLAGALEAFSEPSSRPSDLVRVDILADDGDLLYSSDARYLANSLLGETDQFPLDREELLRGVRAADSALHGVAVVPLRRGSRRIATAVITIDLSSSLVRLATLLGSEVVILDRQGAPLQGTAESDYEHWQGAIDPSVSTIVEHSHRDDVLELASLVAADAGGGRGATLVAVREMTAEIEQRRLGFLASMLWTALAALVPLGILWIYLDRAFRPLEDAVEALSQLSRGRTNHYAELPSGDDEIGRIGQAIEIFREQALQIARGADLEERRRRRQARFIRRQMATLSETLDEEERTSAEADLEQIERAAETPPAGAEDVPSFSAQLGAIGVALERMTDRVVRQQRTLSGMVEELREALAIRTRLASLEQELEIAREMQANVLPRSFPELPGFAIAAQMRPAKEVGGDFYDVFRIDERRVGIAIADVSGKGIPAAFFMLISRTLLKAVALEGLGPARTVTRLNDFLCADNEETMFVTLFYAELEPAEARLTYANCGHNPPLLVSRDSTVAALPETGGMALAVFEGTDFGETTLEMTPGETLVMFTDGVTEAFDVEDVMFGDDRLEALLRELGPRGRCDSPAERTASALLGQVNEAVDRFSGEAPQWDDMTLVVLSALAGGAGEGGEGAGAHG